MAPILSLPKDSLDVIREAVALSVVSIWKVDESSGSKVSLRSGFVLDYDDDTCTVLTLSKDLDGSGNIFVQFENGKYFEGAVAFGDQTSNLVAIVVTGLDFEPKKVTLSGQNAGQCEEVVHMGNFDEGNANLNFSSGSVGLVDHKRRKVLIDTKKESFTRFFHGCSQKLHLIGGPVFNLRKELVGVNYSQKTGKFFFSALDAEQLRIELERLFGKDMERWTDLTNKVETVRVKRRKTQ